MMPDVKDTAQGSAATVAPSMKFKDMSILQKLAFIGKATLCILTFGFAFPNIFMD
jgi:putative Mn2+ efflux pump MntP